MKEIAAGEVCSGNVCIDSISCATRLEIAHCPYLTDHCNGQKCIACGAGIRRDRRCQGQAGVPCREWLADSCAKGIEGYCQPYPFPIEPAFICYCFETGAEISEICEQRWECENL